MQINGKAVKNGHFEEYKVSIDYISSVELILPSPNWTDFIFQCFAQKLMFNFAQWANVVHCKKLGLKLDDQQPKISFGVSLETIIGAARTLATAVERSKQTVYRVFLATNVWVVSRVMLNLTFLYYRR